MMNSTPSSPAIVDCWNHTGVRGDRSCEKLAEHMHCRNCDAYAAAAGAIVQRALPPEYQREWADYFARQESEQIERNRAALVFRVGSEWLALPARLAATVAEVARPHTLPRRRGGALAGIVNVRGRLYPCLSLASLLGIDAAATVTPVGRRIYPRLLVMQFGQQQLALPVDDLYGIHHYAERDVEDVPSTVGMAMHRYLTGVLRIDDMRVGCLDEELLGYQLAGALK
ncbi:MAG TPA: chemotaxis protein CheW [Noviherbaspirillum sp.]|uniref:chemotaxis protein CheW n=1 Tax=Noviherbaspirillum sp. TaxID=1926288 RepID=UPI002D67A83F|nr:chemotaxis protein CheW [Noviherbaspirillum sp.]HYD97563.1 chemotaxis protein CheW [Noviherbaspirillum sp.]